MNAPPFEGLAVDREPSGLQKINMYIFKKYLNVAILSNATSTVIY